jgi:hypothetical protein
MAISDPALVFLVHSADFKSVRDLEAIAARPAFVCVTCPAADDAAHPPVLRRALPTAFSPGSQPGNC